MTMLEPRSAEPLACRNGKRDEHRAVAKADRMDPEPSNPPGESLDQLVLKAIVRCWPTALALGLLTGIPLAAVTWHVIPNLYTARAVLQLTPRQSRAGLSSLDEGPADAIVFQRTQTAVIKSRQVLRAALKRPEVADCADARENGSSLDWLGSALAIEPGPGQELLTATYTTTRPDEAPIILNAVLHSYLETQSQRDQNSRQTMVQQLQERYRLGQSGLQHKRDQLHTLQKTQGSDTPAMVMLRYQAALQLLATQEKEVWQANLALKNASLELDMTRAPSTEDPSTVDLTLDQHLAQDSAFQMLRTRQILLENEIAQIRNVATAQEKDRLLPSHQRQLAEVEQKIAERRRTLAPALTAKRTAELKSKIPLLKQQLTEVTEAARRQGQEVEVLAAQLRQANNEPPAVEALRQEVAQSEQLLRKVADELDLVAMQPHVPARAVVLEEAEVPTAANQRKRMKFAAFAGGFAFFFMALGVVGRAYRLRAIHTGSDLETQVGIRHLGTILSANAATPPLRQMRAGQLPCRALVNALGASREILTDEVHPRSILVTSTDADDGHAHLATVLATQLANQGRRTILVRGNPTRSESELAEVQRGSSPLSLMIESTGIENLDTLKTHLLSPRHADGLEAERIKALIAELTERYDDVVFSARGILANLEPLILAMNVDAVILSVTEGVTPVTSVQKVKNCLDPFPAHFLGAVIQQPVHLGKTGKSRGVIAGKFSIAMEKDQAVVGAGSISDRCPS